MYRPTHAEMINQSHQYHPPYHNQWRPNYRPPAPPPFQWRNRGPEHFRSPVAEPGNREEHWCETCDRGFATLDLLDRHKQQHQKCNIDGCQFVAHPKVITKHIQMQHSSGLYKRISKLDNPEEIQKWRDERKRRYPTQSNIEKKAAESKEKIERGEKMALRNDNRNNRASSAGAPIGNKRKHGFDKGNHRQNRSFKQNDTTKVAQTHPPPKKVPKTLPIAEQKSKLKPFTGILSIEMNETDDYTETLESNPLIEDDDYVEIAQKANIDTHKPVICSALTSLVCDYGSSDDEKDETKGNKMFNDSANNAKLSTLPQKNENRIPNLPMVKQVMDGSQLIIDNSKGSHEDNKNIPKQIIEESKIENTTNILSQSAVIQINESKVDQSDDDSGPEEIKINKKHEDSTESAQDPSAKCKSPQSTVCLTSKQKNNSWTVNRQQPKYKAKHKIPSTLLQKLLSSEIRRERNIILQCIRYVKKNNYFDKAQQ